MTQKVTAFLDPHPLTSKGTMHKLGQITWLIFTAVAATYIVCCCVAFLASGVQSSPTAHSLKLENWRIFDQLLRIPKE